MRIIHLTPGSGDGFYCENCLRDLELVRGLRAAGHESLMVPLYLPIRMERELGPASPVFFGGVNVYLQQKSGLFRRTPRWIDRLFDATGLLRLAGRMTHMTRAQPLGETTLSMLAGEEGRQKKELDRLVRFLAAGERHDVVCLSNVLLAGLVGGVRRGLGEGVKIVCFLQDEDEFLDALLPDHRRAAWAKIAEIARDIDAFIAPSRYYAEFMASRLGLPEGKVHVVRAGVAAEDYSPAESPPEVPVLGYLSPLREEKGLGALVETFLLLKRDSRLRSLRLRAAGGGTAGHGKFLASVRRRLESAGAAGDAEFLPNLAGPERRGFLRGLSVLSVPERRGEAAGFFVLEAFASGVPVVQPRIGASTELIEEGGGGILCDSSEPAELAEAIGRLLTDEALRRELGRRGRESAETKFSAATAARRLVGILEGL